MKIIKTASEIERLRVAGERHGTILDTLAEAVRPGVKAADLDAQARQLVKEYGDTPAFLGYQPEGAAFPYPAGLCVSLNEEVVHGVPREDKVIRDGDIVSLDFGVCHDGVYTDAAITIPVGTVERSIRELLTTTGMALEEGIAVARAGNTVGDIGHAISSYVAPFKYGIIDVLAGHGVGREIHEEPLIPNYGTRGTGETLEPGMVIAIEPMVALKSKRVVLEADGYTYRTVDHAPCAHYEHTVLITDSDPEILTASPHNTVYYT